MIIISSYACGPVWAFNRRRTRGSQFAAGLIAMLAVALAVGPATARAQSPTNDQYDPTLTQIAAGGGSGGGADPASNSLAGLPFTGIDLIAMVTVAACLTALGVVLYRRSRRSTGGVTP